MKRNPSVLLGVLCAALLLSANWAAAQNAKPPTQLTYQGFLTDGNGVPFGNSAPVNKTVIFRIYDALTGGTLKWSSQQVVTVDKGYFSALLGQGSAGPEGAVLFNADLTGVFTGSSTVSDRYLELTADGTTIAPRLRFLPAPYALLAKSATELLDPVTGSNSLSVASGVISGNGANLTNLNASQVATGTLAVARIPDLDAAKVATGTLNVARIPSLDAGKITSGILDNARTTATSANTASAIVVRDGSGNIAAGQVVANSFKINNTQTLVLYGISRFTVTPAGYSIPFLTDPIPGVTQVLGAYSVGRQGSPPAEWWKSTVAWGATPYAGTFTVPAGEVWEVAYSVSVLWVTDDTGALVWTINDALTDDSPNIQFARTTGYYSIGQTFAFSGGTTNVVRVKMGFYGGSGSDAIYYSPGLPAHCVVRKYKSN